MIFHDRRHAGEVLAQKLEHYRGEPDLVVLALPRGGVPVAYVIAGALMCPLDIFVVRKLGVPGHEELAMGAIASGGVLVLNRQVISALGITASQIEAAAEREMDEIERREREYGEDGTRPILTGSAVILVDDGLATGSTMQAAVAALKKLDVRSISVAVPVSAPEICSAFEKEVDEIICARTPRPFRSVGSWYEDFSQTTDEEVRHLLALSRAKMQNHLMAPPRDGSDRR
jgi:predicted phosphoribosyltransferase